MLIEKFISGRPHTNNSSRSRKPGELGWQAEVESQTRDLEAVSGPCELVVEFYLERQSPMSRPSYGPDLDNLLNPIMEGLKKTVLRNDPEGDAAIVSIIAKKHIAASNQLIGAKIILKRVETW